MKVKATLLVLFSIVFSLVSYAENTINYDTLTVGNIRQVVSYSGEFSQPILLFLHGGPGSSRMPQSDIFSNELKNHFLVVQWDQRETGKTSEMNSTTIPITLELMEQDTYEMITALLKKFGKERLYLAGESWGTVLGFRMAEKHPELLNAYLAFSPVIHQTESEQLLKDELLSKNRNDQDAVNEIESIRIPFKDYMDIFYLRKWMFHDQGIIFNEQQTIAVQQYLKTWSDTWLNTWNDAIQQNFSESLTAINCPVYFFIGGKDMQTNHQLATDYFELLQAPEKKLYFFDMASHSVLTEEAEAVQKLIIQDILQK